jgi:hypothetical protein
MTSETLAQIPVIHWEDAMQQVGDDEEFLRELLADLRSETELQLQAIAAIIQVRDGSSWYCFDRVLDPSKMANVRETASNISISFDICVSQFQKIEPPRQSLSPHYARRARH